MTAVKEGVTQPRQPAAPPQQEMQPMGFAVPEPQQQSDYEFPVEQSQQLQQPQPATEWEPATPEMAEIPVALSSTPTAMEIEEVVEAVVEAEIEHRDRRGGAGLRLGDAVDLARDGRRLAEAERARVQP